ncbi:energy transducer TonB [Lysobacter sp. A3-1-A15]|uniref:energy transducer TonB n=1 Tax=Novilysobacter viscosus TaxID=3098602 RepID=UPI003983709C
MNHRLISIAMAATVLTACAPEPQGPPAAPPTELMAVDTPPPAYPEALACDDIGGQTVLAVTVGPEGRPTSVRVKQSSGQPELDVAAQEGVKAWQFRAATRNGQPVASDLQVPVTFKPPTLRPDRCFALDEERRDGEL